MISIFTATLATAFTQDPGIDIRGLNVRICNTKIDGRGTESG